MLRRLGWLFVLVPGIAMADPCALVDEGTVWDHEGQITDIRAMTVLLVTRHRSRQPLAGSPVQSDLWTDDVPSDTLGAEFICDRVQLETPLPLNTWDKKPITMQQGERLVPGLDLAKSAPDLFKRVSSDSRMVALSAASYFVAHVQDLDDPDWRAELLARAADAGSIDTTGWIVGLPGALYLVPMALQ